MDTNPRNIQEQERHPGRPRKYTDPAIFEAKIQEYFVSKDSDESPDHIYSMLELSMFLDIWDYGTLLDYAGYGAEYSQSIARAKARVTVQRQKMLLDGDRKNVRGVEFDLINNHGWTSAREQHQHSGELTTKVIRLPNKLTEGAPISYTADDSHD